MSGSMCVTPSLSGERRLADLDRHRRGTFIMWSTLRSSLLGRSTSTSIPATGTMTYRRVPRIDHLFQPRSQYCRAFDGIVPPHFYGVMAKTELGCQVLQQKGHFSEFAHFVKKHGLEQEDPDIIMKLKSIIWAVVNNLFVPRF